MEPVQCTITFKTLRHYVSEKNQPNQSKLQFCAKSGKYKQYEDVARLVYEDNISIHRVVKSKTLQYFYRRLGINGVSFDSLNICLQEEYHFIVDKINLLLNSRNSKYLLICRLTSGPVLTTRDLLVFIYMHAGLRYVWECSIILVSVALKKSLDTWNVA